MLYSTDKVLEEGSVDCFYNGCTFVATHEFNTMHNALHNIYISQMELKLLAANSFVLLHVSEYY